MRKMLLPLLLTGILVSCKDQKTTDTPLVKDSNTAQTTAKPQASEFADPKYVDMGRNYLRLLQDGKIDEWAAQFADNAVYQWSSGDSLVGRNAIIEYWKNRRDKVIESIQLENDIWLPIKVNQPQRGPDMPGIWLIGWNQVDVKYKNGKQLKFWVHNDLHYNNENKIDRAIQYIDRAPINEALGTK